MATQEQSLKRFREQYSKYDLDAELSFLHDRLNRLLVGSGIADLVDDLDSNLNTAYVAGDLGTAADIAAAFNTTNAALNSLIDSVNDTNQTINAILAKIREDA